MHDWFNAKAASLLVGASQVRVSRQALRTNDNERNEVPTHRDREGSTGMNTEVDDFANDMLALRDADAQQHTPVADEDIAVDIDDLAVMETFATQTQMVRQISANGNDAELEEEDGETLQEVTVNVPPVFRPLTFLGGDDLPAIVEKRIKKGHEAILEEQPKWSLLARILKEIEDTTASVVESHAGLSEVSDISFLTSLMPGRCAWNEYRPDNGLLRPYMSPAPTIPHYYGTNRSPFQPKRRSQDDADLISQQLAAREEWGAPIESSSDEPISRRG